MLEAGPTLSLFCIGHIKLSQCDDLILQKTKLGWIIGGSIKLLKGIKVSHCLVTNLQFDLEQFWALEEVHIARELWSRDESVCENHFKEHTKRNENGKFVVALPFKIRDNLGESRMGATKRLLSLKKRFDSNSEFKEEYTAVMSDYLKLGHMSLIQSSIPSDSFLCHIMPF